MGEQMKEQFLRTILILNWFVVIAAAILAKAKAADYRERYRPPPPQAYSVAPVVIVAPPQQPMIPFSIGTRRVATSRYWRNTAYAHTVAAGGLLSAISTATAAARLLSTAARLLWGASAMTETFQEILDSLEKEYGVPITNKMVFEIVREVLFATDASPEAWLDFLDILEPYCGDKTGVAELREMVAPIALFPDRDRRRQ
jgi:hypothetical protein